MEDTQFNYILMAITTAKSAIEAQLKKKTIEGFNEVKNQFNSLVNMIFEIIPEASLAQRVIEISIRKRAIIVPILPKVVETHDEYVYTSLQQFETIALDVNELSTHTSMQLQSLVSQDLVNREHIIGDHLLKLQENEVETQNIEELNKEKDMLIVEKEKIWDGRV